MICTDEHAVALAAFLRLRKLCQIHYAPEHPLQLLAEARVIEIPVRAMRAIYDESISYSVRAMGIKIGDPQMGKHLWDKLSRVSLPPPLPFPISYIAIAPPLELSPENTTKINDWAIGQMRVALPEVLSEYSDEDLLKNAVGHDILGFLFTEDTAYLIEQWRIATRVGILDMPVTLPITYEGKWMTFCPSASPFAMHALVKMINEHRTVLEKAGSLSLRTIHRRATKMCPAKAPPAPREFYVVHVRDQYIEENRSRLVPPREVLWNHRWDVRAHDVLRVRRGPLPLSEQTRLKLEKRKYRIFTLEDTDAECSRLLAEHRLSAKKTTEWLAMLPYRRQAYVKGPTDKPYIPAVHRVDPPSESD